MTDSQVGPEQVAQLEVAPSPANRKVLASIARNTASMLGVQILIKVFSFIFSVYVVRRLGATDFGTYSAVMAYAYIVAMLTELGTAALSVREMARKPETMAWIVPDIVALRVLLSILVIAGITGAAWILGRPPQMVFGTFLASFSFFLFAFQGPLDGVMISQERVDFSSLANLLNQTVWLLLGTVALLTGTGYIGLLFANLGGILASWIASHYLVKRVMHLQFKKADPRRWWKLLKASIPFGAMGITSELGRRFDTVFMSFVLIYAAVGWYNVPYNLILNLLLVAQSLALSIYPTMIKEYDSGRGSIRDTVQRSVRYLLLVSLPMAIGGMLVAHRIILLLYDEKFAPAIPIMQILVWGLPALFLAEILGRVVITLHRENQAAWMVVLNVLATVGLDLLLIPWWGAPGAAVVMVISSWGNVILALIVIGPGLVFRNNVRQLLAVVGAGVVMGAMVWLIDEAPFLTGFGSKIGLILTMGAGALIYGGAALALGAVTRGELRYLLETFWRRVTRSRLAKA
jgi:O-antigen/teichoic acid export membrane protein